MRVQLIGHKTFATMKAVYHSGLSYEVTDEVGDYLLSQRTDDGGEVFVKESDDGAPVEVKTTTKKVILGGKKPVAPPPAPPADEPPAQPAAGTVTEV